MKILLISILAFYITATSLAQQNSKNAVSNSSFLKDKEAIKSLAGIYKVTFDFAETFSPDTSYKYHERYREWGIECVLVAEETEKKISLQHILIVSDSIIVKHWRQEWIYEHPEIFNYYKGNQWIKTVLKPEQVKGKWTQKIYQVDDGPRYESIGSWVHIDGKHYWEGVCDSPLPRREFSKRNDYNVMRRHSRFEITEDGWCIKQDNEKILRKNGIDKLLCWEKGLEKFTKGNYDAQPAISWWNKNKAYWADVRAVWNDVYTQNSELIITNKIENKVLFEQLFKLGDDYSKATSYNSAEAKAKIKKTIELYLAKS